MGPPLVLAIIVAVALGLHHGIAGAAIGFAGAFLLYLAIGAIVWMGRER